MNGVYSEYWRRKQLLSAPVPYFPVCRWWETGQLCDIEQIYFNAVRNSRSLLDVGAGDLRIMRKLQGAGFQGEYHTQDICEAFSYTYKSLSEVSRTYGAILCLDVIEHLKLDEGLALVDTMLHLLDYSGVLILQTPNARCVRNPLSWDMTHQHLYNLADLWAYLTAAGFEAEGYRVVFSVPRLSPLLFVRSLFSKVVITRLLGADYADNIAVIARRPTPRTPFMA